MAVVPYWAAWPFETLIIPKRPVSRLPDLDDRERDSLADRLIGLLRGYDGLFGAPFPYSMGWHQRRSTASTDLTGSFTPTSTRRSFGRRSASSWSATSFFPSRSAT